MICLTAISFSQTLPNNTFQKWISESSYEYPEDWNTPNPFVSVFPISITTVSKSTDAYSGNYSVFMETKEILNGHLQVPGLITLADFNLDLANTSFSITGGLAFDVKVLSLTGVYKYDGANGDSATALICSYNHNEGEEVDTIGYGVTFLHDSPEWNLFSVDMNYFSNVKPDTFNVLILSSALDMDDLHFMTGSRLYIDSLSVQTDAGIFSIPFERENVIAFPNPATSEITFKTENKIADSYLEIYSLEGRLICSVNYDNYSVTIPVNNLPTGKYVYVIKTNNIIKAQGSFSKL